MKINKSFLKVLLIIFSIVFISNVQSKTLDENMRSQKDLSAIIDNSLLRVLVVYDNVSFFMKNGRQAGLHVALMKQFKEYLIKNNYQSAKDLKIYFIPVRQDEMMRLISEGYGDLALGVVPTKENKRYVDFSKPEKLWINEIVVTTKRMHEIKSFYDLSGKIVHVRESSSYYESLKKVNVLLKAHDLEPIYIVKVDEYLSDADLVDMVDKGEITATVVNDSKMVIWKKMFLNTNFNHSFPIKINSTMSWAMRHKSPEMYKAVNNFLTEYRDGTLKGKPIYDQYMRTFPTFSYRHTKKNSQKLGISIDKFTKFSRIFKNYGEKFKIDWMLLMAQSYQESTLNPKALSNRGAVGIMQVLPSTAKEKYINVNSVHDVDNNVHAGTKYMRYMLDNYFNDSSIDQSEKILFALAGYNCGPNRITKYRKEALLKGYNPNKWFNNVEKIAIEHGIVETVKYVRNISSLYVTYQQMYLLENNKQLIPRL